MKQMKNEKKLTVKSLMITVLVAFAVYFLLNLLCTAVLSNTPHFERFYNLASWLITFVLAFVIALISRSADKIAFLQCGLTLLLFSIISFAIGMIVGHGNFDLLSVLLRDLALILFGLLSTFVLAYFKSGRRKRENRKFRFSK